MKKIEEIKTFLKSLESVLGFDPCEVQQGSDEWHNMKLGVISASNAAKLMSSPNSEAYKNYMAELVSQVCTGEAISINANSLKWGNENEQKARSSYEFLTGKSLYEVPFYYKDNSMRAGCSPDCLDDDLMDGDELKCPKNSKNFIRFVDAGDFDKDYLYQVNFSMWVTDRDSWNLTYFDPRMKRKPLHTMPFNRDESIIRKFEQRAPVFMQEMDYILSKFGMKFGDQWPGDIILPSEEILKTIFVRIKKCGLSAKDISAMSHRLFDKEFKELSDDQLLKFNDNL